MGDIEVYYKKYKKYKKKYFDLLKVVKFKYDFYFIHFTKEENLISILKDGYLKLGEEVPLSGKFFSGHDLPYIYSSIYFPDIKNLQQMRYCALLLRPEIVKKYGCIFNKSMAVGPTEGSIFLNKIDSFEILNDKLKKIRKFLKNPDLPEKLIGYYSHEVLFSKRIQLEDNLLAIVYNVSSDKKIKKIQDVIINKPYANVKIIRDSSKFPLLKDLI